MSIENETPPIPVPEDFIRPGEQAEFDELSEELLDQLTPDGPLEYIHFNEIVTASWRLRRCRIVEAALALRADGESALAEADEKRQLAADRARALAGNNLKRATGELRKLQTERQIRAELRIECSHPLIDFAQVLRALRAKYLFKQTRASSDGAAFDAALEQALGAPGSPMPGFDPAAGQAPNPTQKSDNPFCKTSGSAGTGAVHPAPRAGRNEPCPCKSGLKFKKCCLNQPRTEVKPAA